MSDYDFHWSCDQRAIKGALERLKKTFGKGSGITTLNNLEVTPDPFNGGALLRVSDLVSHHTVPVPGICSGDRLMLDFRQLLKIVDALPSGEITIRGEAPAPIELIEVEKFQCDISTQWKKVPYKVMEPKPRPAQKVLGMIGKKAFSLFRWDHIPEGCTLPDAPVLYPGIPHVTVKLDMTARLAPVLHAVADDSRYGLNGVQLEIYPDNSVGAVSTDGHRCVAHQAQLDAEEYNGPLLPLQWASRLKCVAPGKVTLSWWQTIVCGGALSGLAAMDQDRLRENSPLYRVHFDLGGDASRTVVRERKQVTVYKRNSEGRDTPYLEQQESVSVIQDKDPRMATCTVRTSPETLTLLLTSQISLDDWLVLPDVTVSGSVFHLRALYDEAPRSNLVQIEHPDGTMLTTRCIEGDFPDWRQIVPKNFLRSAIVDRKVLEGAVKYVLTGASELTHSMCITVRESAIILSASMPDTGELSDEVPAEITGDVGLSQAEVTDIVSGRRKVKLPEKDDPRVGDTFRIGVCGSYLLDELKVLGGDRVEIQFKDRLSAMILRRPGDDSLICIVMPMRLE